jgi:signal transduction histidine kinase
MLNLLTVMGKTSTDANTDFIELINTAASIARKAHPELNIKITKIVDDKISLTSISRLLSLVFENLFRNAAQYAGLHPEIEVIIEKKKETIEVKIMDNGSGISIHIQDQLFQKGVSSKKGGGYGLYLSKEILRLIGGSIELDSSSENSGAVFVINISS